MPGIHICTDAIPKTNMWPTLHNKHTADNQHQLAQGMWQRKRRANAHCKKRYRKRAAGVVPVTFAGSGIALSLVVVSPVN
jgi:hypothetical protein